MPFQKGNKAAVGRGRPRGPGTGPGSIRVKAKAKAARKRAAKATRHPPSGADRKIIGFAGASTGKPGRPRGGGSKQLFTKLFNEALDDSMFEDFITQLRTGISEGKPWALKLLASKVLADKQELTVNGQFDGDYVWERVMQEYAEFGPVLGPTLAASSDEPQLQLPPPPATSGDLVSPAISIENLEPAGCSVADRAWQVGMV